MFKKAIRVNKCCEVCTVLMRGVLRSQKYCSRACNRKAQRPSTTGLSLTKKYNLSTGQLGAMSELIVCADLIRSGFEVFRAVSPSSSCDLIILKDGAMQRVEVRTGLRYKNGEISNTFHRIRDKGRSDMLVHVVDGEPIYNTTKTEEIDAESKKRVFKV